MAKIGLKYPVYKSATNEGVIAKAIQADIDITTNDIYLYADDGVAESDKSFLRGSLTLGIDDLSDTVQKEFLGHKVGDSPGEIVAHGDDDSPYVSIGFYGVKKVNGARKYRAIWLTQVQFAEPSDSNATKVESVVFNTPVLTGTIMRDNDGNWKREKTFDTEAQAITYLQALSGVKEQCKTPVSNLESRIYADETPFYNVEITAGEGEDIYYTTNGTTPSATNGTKVIGNTDLSNSVPCGLKAIAVAAGKNNSEVATYEYFLE